MTKTASSKRTILLFVKYFLFAFAVITIAYHVRSQYNNNYLIDLIYNQAQYNKHYQPTRSEIEFVIEQILLYDVKINDVYLFCGKIEQESGWNPTARSKVGARGLFQIKPDTARDYCERHGIEVAQMERALYNPAFNIRVGIGIYTELFEMYGRDPHCLPMTIWNEGCGTVGRAIESGKALNSDYWNRVKERTETLRKARSGVKKRKGGEQ